MECSDRTRHLPIDVSRYTGIPYRERGHDYQGCDCWGLIRLVYRDKRSLDIRDIRDNLYQLRHWVRVKGPVQPYDVFVFRMSPVRRHVSMAINHLDMLHIDRGFFSCIEQRDSQLWIHRLQRIYRHAALVQS